MMLALFPDVFWETLPTVLFLPFLMKEFPVGGNTIQVQLFGWCLSSTSMAIKFAVGRLKARCNALRREMLITTDFPSGIYASFVLHNYCD